MTPDIEIQAAHRALDGFGIGREDGDTLADRITIMHDSFGHRLAAPHPPAEGRGTGEGMTDAQKQAIALLAYRIAGDLLGSPHMDAAPQWIREYCDEPRMSGTDIGEAIKAVRDAFAASRLTRSPRAAGAPTLTECDACDGCGWTEGGAALKTTCRKCGGTGAV